MTQTKRESQGALSRSGRSNPLGKCTEELKTTVPEKIKADFIEGSTMPTAGEELRDVIVKHLYGHVPEDMKDIVWERAQAETDCPFLRKLLYRSIYGSVHENIVSRQHPSIQGENRARLS
jgi:hypothetical protein